MNILKKRITKIGLGAVLTVTPMILYAQVVDDSTVPTQVILDSVVDIIKNGKGMTGIGAISAIVAILVQICKATFLKSIWEKWGILKQHAFVVSLGIISQILILVAKGQPWIDALIGGLVTGGGAVAIYEAVSGVFKGPKV